MKRFLVSVILAITLLISSCYRYYDPSFAHSENFSSQEEVLQWVSDNIDYESDRRYGEDEWQLPQETYQLLSGDCEDFVILAMYFLKEIGIESSMAIIQIDGHTDYHAVLIIDSEYYEAQSGNIITYSFRLEDIFEYDYVMYFAMYVRNLL